MKWTSSVVSARDVEAYPSHAPLADGGVLQYTRHRAVTTRPQTRVEGAVLGRLAVYLSPADKSPRLTRRLS
jgi:hypothetical protein